MSSLSRAEDAQSTPDAKTSEFSFHAFLDKSTDRGVGPDAEDGDILDGISLTESIFDYPKENGRTYHAFRAGSYLFPNDPIERERLDSQHEIIKLLLGNRNYLAPWTPAHPPTKVLDVATGTGRWAVELGDEFPTAAVIGIDLSPIQPTLVPPNVNFFIEDALDDWEEPGVDYIHTRFTTGCWRDMAADVVAKAFRTLEPGGWLECQELQERAHCDDGSLAPDMPLAAWCRDLVAAAERVRRSLRGAAQLRAWFEAAGFVDVVEHVYQLPINGWPRDVGEEEEEEDDDDEDDDHHHHHHHHPDAAARLGELWERNLLSGLPAFSYGLMHRVLGRSKAEIEVSLVDVRKNVTDRAVHAYHRFYVVCGRKPPRPDRSSSGSSGSSGRSGSSGSTLAAAAAPVSSASRPSPPIKRPRT